MQSADVLVVFARYPVSGRVKTRLARAIGEDAAARLYDAFVRDLAGRFRSSRFDVRWEVAPPDLGFATRFGLPPASCGEQTGTDLGVRMENAFARVLSVAPARCVLIGSDAPHLSTERVEEAFARLDAADLVLGPSRDGGYYLIGMSRPCAVFSGIRWSSSEVLAATRRRAAAMGLSVALLEPDFDVDEAADLELLRARLARGGLRDCPATACMLEELAHP